MTAEMRVGLDAVGEISVDCEKIKKKKSGSSSQTFRVSTTRFDLCATPVAVQTFLIDAHRLKTLSVSANGP